MKIADGYLLLDQPGAELRVLMLHHAGGSAMSYLPIARQLPASCEPLLFELPGRGLRAAEPAAPDFSAAVTDLTPRLAAVIDRPVLVFGHSLGAILAHSVVSGLPPRQRALVRTVVVSSYAAPKEAARYARHPEQAFQLRDRDSLVTELREHDGSPEELFAEPDLLNRAVTLLGHDMHLADTYRPPAPIEIEADYQVWRGRDDPRPTAEQQRGWAEVCQRPPAFREFDGGHFYLLQAPAAGQALGELVRSMTVR